MSRHRRSLLPQPKTNLHCVPPSSLTHHVDTTICTLLFNVAPKNYHYCSIRDRETYNSQHGAPLRCLHTTIVSPQSHHARRRQPWKPHKKLFARTDEVIFFLTATSFVPHTKPP
ncbi:hypothetical protein DEO72_LG10g2098 [Vigna unguiculata]|uniref:Uncharacterized protein n=1 Tax=Vigna unguiculata TaxID=3917 RepID=A0A4D6NAV2_VIGUN|nr:hypothetical protein DEO72_LG10g2098 [Vigna unguiculata]